MVEVQMEKTMFELGGRKKKSHVNVLLRGFSSYVV